MGLGGSRIQPNYYDNTFGHAFGRIPELGPGDLDKAFYSPISPREQQRRELLQSQAPAAAPVVTKPAKAPKQKKVKQPKHPQKNRVYYYYEEPETIYVPQAGQQAPKPASVIIQQVPVPVPVPVPVQSVAPVSMYAAPTVRRSRVPRSVVYNEPPRPLRAY